MNPDLADYESVDLSSLSALCFEILVSPHERWQQAEIKVLRFAGEYQGRDDALFIAAMSKAAHVAWYSDINVLDLSDFRYEGGDEIDWIFNLGWDPVVRLQLPLVVVVSDLCRDRIRSWLGDEEFESYCRDSMDEAIELGRRKRDDWDRAMEAWRLEH